MPLNCQTYHTVYVQFLLDESVNLPPVETSVSPNRSHSGSGRGCVHPEKSSFELVKVKR